MSVFVLVVDCAHRASILRSKIDARPWAISTNHAGLGGVMAVSTTRSLNRMGGQASSSKAFSTYYNEGDKRTISDFGRRKASKKMLTSKESESNFAGD